MTELTLSAAFLVGLAGGVHCIGMCGGVISAFSMATPKHKSKVRYALFYNLGRIISYSLLGALTGFIGGIVSSAVLTDLPLLNYISIAFLYLLALYISDIWKGLAYLERLGRLLWLRIQPLSKHFLPVKSPFHAIMYGAIWGFLPCGLIYSALTWSLASGSSVKGAMLMLSFGLGTLPSLLLISFGFASVVPYFQKKVSRMVIAFLLFASASVLLYQQIIANTL